VERAPKMHVVNMEYKFKEKLTILLILSLVT